jgi:hypothetical protein
VYEDTLRIGGKRWTSAGLLLDELILIDDSAPIENLALIEDLILTEDSTLIEDLITQENKVARFLHATARYSPHSPHTNYS